MHSQFSLGTMPSMAAVRLGHVSSRSNGPVVGLFEYTYSQILYIRAPGNGPRISTSRIGCRPWLWLKSYRRRNRYNVGSGLLRR